MAGKVLSIEVGYSLTRVCEVDFKAKTPKVHKSFTVPTLEGVMNDGVLTPDPHYVEGLRGGLRENVIKTKQIVFSIASAKIATREIVIPYVKEKQIAAVVQANAAEYFPVDLSQYQLAYSILEVMGDKKGEQQYKLLVLAVPQAMLKGYYELAASLRMEIAAFDYVGNSLYQVMKKECSEGAQLVAKIDERSTLIMVIKEGQIVFTRNVAYGVEEALQAVMESVAWGSVRNMRQAIQTVEKFQCIDLTDRETAEMTAPVNPSLEEAAQINVTDALSPMIGGIARVLDYYASRGDSAPIDKVLVTGIGANFLGMGELLNREINYPVFAVKKVEGFNLEKYFKDGFFGEYLACIGASISPLGFLSEEEEKKKKKASVELLPDEKGMFILSIIICVGGVILAGALAGVSLFGYYSEQKEQVRLKNRIAELEPIETVYLEYLQQQYTFNKLTYFENSTVTPNENMVAFLEEMEEKMPSSLYIQSFNADLNGITLSVTVDNKDDAARMIQQFRTFETIGGVAVASITDTGAVMDGEVMDEEPMVSFTLTATYRGNEEEAAAAAETAAAAEAAAETEAEQTEE
ncbi:MAG: PilN domain-containing protein [Muribaculaceae bacterium]|nr:PilN domain-containing protein [Muribaculaceae bacterium]